MAEEPPPEVPGPWSVAVLYAGLFLNAGLLGYVGRQYYFLADPWRLGITLLLYVLFLSGVVFYIPVRLGAARDSDTSHLVESYLGKSGALIFHKIVVPVWAATWFAYISLLAIGFLESQIFRGSAWSNEFVTRDLPIAVIWLAMVAPSAGGSLLHLVRSSIFVGKVSIALILGLGLSSLRHVPDQLASLHSDDYSGHLPPLELVVLFWALPALLLSDPLVRSFRHSRGSLVKLVVLGIAAPLVFAVLAALLTMAGAAGLDMRYGKIPEYIRYAAGGNPAIGRAKLLLLTFTLLTATRFAANQTVRALTRRGGLPIGLSITALLLAGTFGLQKIDWAYRAWEYAAVPFCPLSGTLCGAFMINRVFHQDPDGRCQRLSLLTWIVGCIVPLVALQLASHRYSGVGVEWILLGWTIAFAGTVLPGIARARSSKSTPSSYISSEVIDHDEPD